MIELYLLFGLLAFLGSVIILSPSSIVKLLLRLVGNIIVAIPSSYYAWQVFSKGTLSKYLFSSPITGVWEIRIDLLSAFFILIINLITVLSATYGAFYLKNNTDKKALNLKLISSLILHVSMLAVCVAQGFLPFLISWELMSMSSLFMVIFQFGKQKTLSATVNYLVQMHLGVALIMLAMIMVANETGSYNWDAVGEYFFNQPKNFWIFLAFFLGFGFKVGFVPIHTWMPDTYKVAPAHTAGLMSGVLKKMGLFGILKVLLYVQSSRLEIGIFILSISLVTGLYGIVNAILQKDIKKILAYSSMENMGLIGIGIGMGMIGFGVHDLALAYLGFSAALLQILNHALFKSALFFVNGNVYQQTATRNINELGGLAKSMPITSIFFLLLSMAACGLPPFNGFVAKYLVYSGMIEGMNATFVTTEVFLLVSLIVLSLVGGLAIYAYSKLYGLTFLGNARTTKSTNATEVSYWMQLPILVLTLIGLSIGLFPEIFFDKITMIVDEFVPQYSHISLKSYSNLYEIGHASIIFIVLVSLLVLLRKWLLSNREVSYQPTWGCGYAQKNVRMQYSAESWADYFVKFGGIWTKTTNSFVPFAANDIFPQSQEMKIEQYDKVEFGIIKRMIRVIKFVMKQIAVVQTGQTQYYILYAFVFLLLMSLLTFFKLI